MGQVRLRKRDDFQPGRLFGRDLRFLHPALAFGIRPQANFPRGRVTGEPESIVQVATPEVVECHPDLPAHDGVDHVGDRVHVLNLGRRFRLRRDQLHKTVEIGRAEPELRGFAPEQGAIGDGQAALRRAEPYQSLQLIQLLIALDAAGGGEFGVIGRARGRVAEQRLPERGNLVEIRLERVLCLGVARSRRPDRLLARQRRLDRRAVGSGVDAKHRVVVGNHRPHSSRLQVVDVPVDRNSHPKDDPPTDSRTILRPPFDNIEGETRFVLLFDNLVPVTRNRTYCARNSRGARVRFRVGELSVGDHPTPKSAGIRTRPQFPERSRFGRGSRPLRNIFLASQETGKLVPTLCVGMPSSTLCVVCVW